MPAAIPTAESSKAPSLVRGLGVWAATAVVIGSMIGQGIFLVSSQIARDVGSVERVITVWIIGGVIVLFGAFCYAELGAAIPDAGGDYIYLSRGIGPLWGYSYGWMSSFIGRPATGAIIAAGLLRFTGFLAPSVATPIFTFHIPVFFQAQPYPFTFTRDQPLAAAVIIAVTGINYFGIRTAGRVQIILTSLKVAAVVCIVVLGLTLGRVSGFHSGTPLPHSLAGAFLIALVPVMTACNGFQFISAVGGEINNPQRNIPRAAIFGVLSVVGLYVLINLAYFHVLTFTQVEQSRHLASDAMQTIAGETGAKWLTIVMMLSALGALHCNFMTGPRVPYAMSRDGQFFRFAKQIQPVFRSPSGAVVFQGCMTTLLVLTGTYEEIYSLDMFAVWIFLLLTAVALIRLRIHEPALARPYRAWGYPWTTLIFAAAALAMTVNLWLVRPIRSSIGLALILLGIPFFFYWRKRAAAKVFR